MQERLLTAKQVAERLNFKYRTVINMTERGELPGFKISNEWRYKESEVAAFIEAQANLRRGNRDD